MTIPFQKGRYQMRFADAPGDLRACQALRHACFFGTPGLDADRFDERCLHLMVTDQAGQLVATVRLLQMRSGAEIANGYAAQFYDLSGLARVNAPMIEIGRFCIAPEVLDADVLRVAWGALTRLVDEAGVAMLFGCSSFAGTDPAIYGRAFTRLATRHQGPARWRPAAKAPRVHPLAATDATGAAPMPPLLRTYLAMGGWVGDHAVVDPVLNTLHVFTCLEVAAVPPARARALRALAG